MASVFDNLEDLKLSAADVGGGLTQQVLTHIPVGRTNGQTFFRVHPAWSLTTTLLFDAEGFGRDAYFVLPGMRAALMGDAKPVLLVPTMTRQGVFGFWAVKLPLDDTNPNPWHQSAREAAERASIGGSVSRRIPTSAPIASWRRSVISGSQSGPIARSTNCRTSRFAAGSSTPSNTPW